jgi:hypothetical protein
MSVINQIIEAQQFIIANPARSCVNSESSFVKQRLQQQGFAEAANLYWNFTCSNGKRYISDSIVVELEMQLSTTKFNMPAWGLGS